MRRLHLLVQAWLALVLLSACRTIPETVLPHETATSPPPTAAGEPTTISVAARPAATATTQPIPPSRVILISVDAGRADWLDAAMQDGTMPYLAQLREGGRWGTISGIGISSSVVGHYSLASGSLPAQTGIAGDRLHRPEEGLYWYTSAYDLSSGAKPIWDSAQRSGRMTAVLFWPGAQPGVTEPLPEYAVGYGERAAYSKLHTLGFSAAQSWVEQPPSFSPPQESQFVIIDIGDAPLATIYVLALDTLDDGDPAYDSFILSIGDRAVSKDDARLSADSREGSTTYWTMDANAGAGAAFIIANPSLTNFTLYQGNVYRLVASPESLQRDLADRFGFFAPPPDYYALEHGWITAEDYLAMMLHHSEWKAAVTTYVYETYRPDLLLTVQTPLDEAGHQFLLVDERQPGYSSQLALTYSEYLNTAAAALDRAVEQIAGAAEGDNTALLVIGTSGMASVHTQVNVNTLLEQAGLLRLGSRGFVIVERSQAIAFSSGGAAHIYINRAGRDAAGIVPTESYPDVESQIAALFRELTDPTTGEPVFSQVLRQVDLGFLGLDAELAGDVVVLANPGYTLSDDRGVDEIFVPPAFYGQQGYDAQWPEMQGGILLTGLASNDDALSEGTIQLIDVAPTIAMLLGFELPEAEGRVIPGIFGP